MSPIHDLIAQVSDPRPRERLASLTERPFVGTESRLLTLFARLEQISAGTEADPVKCVTEPRRKREEPERPPQRLLAQACEAAE